MTTISLYPQTYTKRAYRVGTTTTSGVIPTAITDKNSATYVSINAFRSAPGAPHGDYAQEYDITGFQTTSQTINSATLNYRLSATVSAVSEGFSADSWASVDVTVYNATTNAVLFGSGNLIYAQSSDITSETLATQLYSLSVPTNVATQGIKLTVGARASAISVEGIDTASAASEVDIHDAWLDVTYSDAATLDNTNTTIIPTHSTNFYGAPQTVTVVGTAPSGVYTRLLIATSWNGDNSPKTRTTLGVTVFDVMYEDSTLTAGAVNKTYTSLISKTTGTTTYRIYLVTTTGLNPFGTMLSYVYKDIVITGAAKPYVFSNPVTPTAAYKSVESNIQQIVTVNGLDQYIADSRIFYGSGIQPKGFIAGNAVATTYPYGTMIQSSLGQWEYEVALTIPSTFTGSSVTMYPSWSTEAFPVFEPITSSATINMYNKPNIVSFSVSNSTPAPNASITISGSFTESTYIPTLSSSRTGTITIPSITTVGNVSSFSFSHTIGTVAETLTLLVIDPLLGGVSDQYILVQPIGSISVSLAFNATTVSGNPKNAVIAGDYLLGLITASNTANDNYSISVTGTGSGLTYYKSIPGVGDEFTSPADFATWDAVQPLGFFIHVPITAASGEYYDITVTNVTSGITSTTQRVTVGGSFAGIKSAESSN